MTGVLPIKKYSSGSALNMFDEFTFLKDRKFGEYFGFTEDEVLDLCEQNKYMDFKKLEEWYNGYTTARGIKIYNPRSVVKALKNDYCESYWTNTGAMDEVSQYLKYNVLEIRDDVIKMVSGQEIDITIDEEFRAGQGTPKTKEEIYSAMIVLGFLSYNDGYLKIPNKELMIEFEKALRDKSFGYVSEIIENSRTMLKATVNKDTENMDTIKKVFDLWSTPEYGNLYFQSRPGFPNIEGIDGNESAMNPDIPKIYNEYMKDGRVVAQMNQYIDTLQPLFGNTIWVYYLEAPSKGNMDGKDILDRFQKDVDKFMTEKGAEGWK